MVGDGVGMIPSSRPGKRRFAAPSEAGVTASLSACVCGRQLVAVVCVGGARLRVRSAVGA